MSFTGQDIRPLGPQILEISCEGPQLGASEDQYWGGHPQPEQGNRQYKHLLLQHAHSKYPPLNIRPEVDILLLDGIRLEDIERLVQCYASWPSCIHNVVVREENVWRSPEFALRLLRRFRNLRLVLVRLNESRSCLSSGSVTAGGYRQRAEALLARDMAALRGHGPWTVRYVDYSGKSYIEFKTLPRGDLSWREGGLGQPFPKPPPGLVAQSRSPC